MNRAELQDSAASLAQMLEAAPDFANGWFTLGEMRRQLGETGAAIAAYRKALDADPSDMFGASLRLAHLGAQPLCAMPEAYVRGMFDQYAPHFDADLVGALGYRAPALLRAAVNAAGAAQGRAAAYGTMLDLGCGTGLAGAAFRDSVREITGVDISPGMIAAAREKKIQDKSVYDRLETDDIVRFLGAEDTAGRTYELIVAADVFAYFPDLAGVVRAVTNVMAEGSLLAFTVETHQGDGVLLGEGLRYAHGLAHVRAALAGLTVLELRDVSTRNEAGSPVPGLLAVAAQGKRDGTEPGQS